MAITPVVRNFLVTCGVLAVVLLGAFVVLRRPPTSAPTQGVATSTQNPSSGVEISGLPAGATVTEVPTQSTPVPAAPDFHTPIAYDSTTSVDVKTAIEAQFMKDVAALGKDATDFNAWMDLAVLHKMGGDYHGAETIWLYVIKRWPTSYVAFHNLGDLYQNFLHEPTLADKYFALAAKVQGSHQ